MVAYPFILPNRLTFRVRVGFGSWVNKQTLRVWFGVRARVFLIQVRQIFRIQILLMVSQMKYYLFVWHALLLHLYFMLFFKKFHVLTGRLIRMESLPNQMACSAVKIFFVWIKIEQIFHWTMLKQLNQWTYQNMDQINNYRLKSTQPPTQQRNSYSVSELCRNFRSVYKRFYFFKNDYFWILYRVYFVQNCVGRPRSVFWSYKGFKCILWFFEIIFGIRRKNWIWLAHNLLTNSWKNRK